MRSLPPERGSELALDELRLEPGASLDLCDELHDTLAFVLAGSGALGNDRDRRSRRGLRPGRRGRDARRGTGRPRLRPRDPGRGDRPARAHGACRARRRARSTWSPGKATGARSFQLLHGPHNGSTRATLFVGYIPPGRAPWHYHLYDEIVWVLSGAGRLHLGDEVEELGAGSAFRLHPREVHIVENTSTDVELAVLGVFTPAGSPSAAYLTADVAETYAIAG